LAQRRTVSTLIDEACRAGAALERARAVAGITPRTLQRWREADGIRADARAAAARARTPANRLSDAERDAILAVANAPEFAHLPPTQIVPMLADRGRWIASESTFYRVLRAAGQLQHRGRSRAPSHQRPEPLQATAANQLWSWDTTYPAHRRAGRLLLPVPDRGCLQPQDRRLGGVRDRGRRHANGSLIFATSSLTATEIKDAPRVRLEDKLEVERLGSGFFAAVLRLGYMERPRFDTILDLLSQTAYPPSAEHPSLFLSRARIGTANVRAAIRWRARLYAFMQRNTPSPDFLLDAPSEQLIEIGVHYEL
jgi:hypothetical protein